jgi:SH3 domain-containing YSC84-like protein 1
MNTAISAAMAVVLTAAGASAAAVEQPRAADRPAQAAQVVQVVRPLIPREIFERARCVMVLPQVKKAAFMAGGEQGRGLMSCRSANRWSPPVLMELAKGSWGFQPGVQEVDLVLLVMNENGVQKLLSNKVTLAADASVAAGPLGTGGAVASDATMNAEILTYSRARGLFAGVDLSGGVLRPDDDANKDVYGPTASVRTILAGTEISAPPQAAPFLAALSAAAPSAASTSSAAPPAVPVASTPAPPKTAPPPADDLLAQLSSMLETLDTMLSNPQPIAIAGAGAADPAATSVVTVERAQLLRLRQRIDALLASANRR